MNIPDESPLQDLEPHLLRVEGVPQDVVHVRDPDPDPGVRAGRAVAAPADVDGRRPHVVLPEGAEEVGAELAADRVVEERLGDGERLGSGHLSLELDGEVGVGTRGCTGGRDEGLRVDVQRGHLQSGRIGDSQFEMKIGVSLADSRARLMRKLG